jgi:hypothetical protein
MCRIRTSSGCVIESRRCGSHLVPEATAEILVRSELDLSASEELGKLELQRGEPDEPWRTARLELDEEVDVAVGTLLPSAHRPEEREAPDAMQAAEGGESS